MKIKAILVLFAVGVLGLSQVGMAAKPKEADTIDELLKLYDNKPCMECHTEAHDEWSKSWHAKAVVSSLKGMRNFIKVGLEKEWKTPLTKAQLLKCLDCHAPVVNFASEKLAREIGEMIVTAFEEKDNKKGAAAQKELAKLSVGCTSCHNIKATSVAKGLRGEPKYGVVYGPNGNDSDGHESIESVEMGRSLFCMQCHGIYTAPDGEKIQCNTLSGSYQDAYINLGGSQTCQDCHMKDTGHFFPGGHDLATVKKGLGFNVQITDYRHLPGQVPGVKNKKAWVPSALVTAFIENKTGHRVPDG